MSSGTRLKATAGEHSSRSARTARLSIERTSPVSRGEFAEAIKQLEILHRNMTDNDAAARSADEALKQFETTPAGGVVILDEAGGLNSRRAERMKRSLELLTPYRMEKRITRLRRGFDKDDE